VRFYLTMTIDGELSVRSMFSGPIIDKLVYSIKKQPYKNITCMWELMLNDLV